MKLKHVVVVIVVLAMFMLLAGCGGNSSGSSTGDSVGGGIDTGGGGGTDGGGGTQNPPDPNKGSGTTVKSGDGTYTGGGTYEYGEIKIVGPEVAFPTDFTYMGGEITISATVTSSGKISLVRAEVTPPNGITENIAMKGSGTYKCKYDVKANLSLLTPAVYQIKVSATNEQGIYSVTAPGILTIAPPSEHPPDAPL